MGLVAIADRIGRSPYEYALSKLEAVSLTEQSDWLDGNRRPRAHLMPCLPFEKVCRP